MNLFNSVETSYKTRANAVKKLEKFFGDDLANQRWFIVALEDGRYAPCIVRDEFNLGAAHYGICVVG